MELRGVVWLGTRTPQFDEMVSFAQEVLGLRLVRGDDGLAAFALPNGDTFEVFDQAHPGGGHPDGVAAGFLVDNAGEFRWAYFRAPDGNLYEVTSGPY